MRVTGAVPLALAVVLTVHLPGVEAKVLFSTSPATGARLLQEAFLVGNGRLGGMFSSKIVANLLRYL
jgi:hypothetical protein